MAGPRPVPVPQAPTPRGRSFSRRSRPGTPPSSSPSLSAFDTLGGDFNVLLSEGTRLPASYEERRFVETRETEAIQLHFRGAADEPGGEKRSIGLFVSDSLGIAPGGLPHLTARVAVDQKGMVTITVPSAGENEPVEVGSVRVRKAGPSS